MTLFKSQTEIVKEIHSAIDSAQDRLLGEAKRIIADNSNLDDKAIRLKEAGFHSSERVVKLKTKLNLLVENKEQAELIEYYKVNYPFQKFITEKELEAICDKYKLIFKPVENYCKDVPIKNLEEIEKCKERMSCDMPENKKWCKLKRDNSFFIMNGNGGLWCGIWGSEWYRIPSKINDFNFRNGYDASQHLRDLLGFKATYLIRSVKNFQQDRQGLFICAPKSHFSGKDKSISFFEAKDPIVFRFVRGGIQIITKWGIESEDKLLFNEINN